MNHLTTPLRLMTLGLLLVSLTSCSFLGYIIYRPETVPPFNGDKTVYIVKEGQVVTKENDGWVLISKGFLQELYKKARHFEDLEENEKSEEVVDSE